jgi:hypothetical protein
MSGQSAAPLWPKRSITRVIRGSSSAQRPFLAEHLRLAEPAPKIPNESQFSRAFASFAESELPQPLHAALIEATEKDRMIGHNSRHSIGIEAREKPVSNPVSILTDTSERKRGSPRKGRDTAA